MPPEKSDELVATLVERYRLADPAKVPSNVPTACVVTGSEAPELLYSGDLQDKEQLYVFFENLQSVRLTSGRDLSAFLRDREPWEDYDICVFEEGLEWAAFLTHDDRTVLIDPYDVLCHINTGGTLGGIITMKKPGPMI